MRLASVVLSVGMLLFGAAPARAQVYVEGLGGVTMAAEQHPFFAGAVGARLLFLEINGEVGHMRNVPPRGVFDALNQLQADSPVKAIAHLRNTYGLVNVRLTSPGPLGLFVAGGVGVAHLQPGFDVSAFGISLGDVFGLTSFEARNEPMWTAGAGLIIRLPHSGLEAGYRYFRIHADYQTFNVSSGPFGVHAVYGGLMIRF